MNRRFFCPEPIHALRCTLTGPEAHHLVHVLRAKIGMPLTVFDGQGHEFRARIATLAKSTVELDIIDRLDADRESPCRVTLGVALPKGERQRMLVEKCVELGVQRVVPLRTERGVAQPTDAALKRLRRSVIEASKQCGRNRLMDIAKPESLDDFLASGAQTAVVKWLAHPDPRGPQRTPVSRGDHAEIGLAIGPEGGFTDEELSWGSDSGWTIIHLGPRVLRTETAAIALASFWLLRIQASD